MSDQSVIEDRISSVKKYLDILKRYRNIPKETLFEDVDRRGALERYLYLACQAAIEVGESLIAYRRFRKPVYLSDTFVILQENGVVNSELSEKLIRMTGFRNALAHDYDELNYEVVYSVLHDGVNDIESFVEIAERELRR